MSKRFQIDSVSKVISSLRLSSPLRASRPSKPMRPPSNYKAPSNDDHIGVAMIHVDKKLAKKKAALKSLPEQSRLTLLSGYEICHAFGAAERDAQ